MPGRRKTWNKIPCGCGCGEMIFEEDEQGKKRKYKKGHHVKGKKCPERSLRQLGEKSNSWKGDGVTLKQLHSYLRKWKPKVEYCEICDKKPPYDLANIEPKYNKETYNRDFNNWRWLCRRCHMYNDGRIKLWVGRKHSDETKKNISDGLKEYYKTHHPHNFRGNQWVELE